MKATGIIRRIDELGRIVIPKEIRKNLRIKENENLEIYIDNNDKIILKKYSAMKNIKDIATQMITAMSGFVKHTVVITDTDQVLAITSNKKEKYLNKEISEKLSNSIMRRETMLEKYKKEIEIVEGEQEIGSYAISTIICNGDAVGLVLLISENEDLTQADENIVKIASNFFGKYLEE